jgi:hypothetical protein
LEVTWTKEEMDEIITLFPMHLGILLVKDLANTYVCWWVGVAPELQITHFQGSCTK